MILFCVATMRPADNQGSFLGRISIRRNQMEGNNEEQEELELFQRHIADRFADLVIPSTPHDEAFPSDPLLSISWLRKLLDMFLCCEAQFKAVLLTGRDPTQIFKPPLDRLVPEFLERVVKALDICNAVILGIESLRHFQKIAEIVIPTLEQKPLGDGQVRRAKKALHSLITAMTFEDKEGSNAKSTERSWSFGRRGAVAANKDRSSGQVIRTLSCAMAKNWSASKQIHAMSSNLVAPKGGEVTTMAMPVYIMSTVIVFVMWALVAAIPCQERNGLGTHFQVPRNLIWAQSLSALQDKIAEEWKKKEKKGSAGLLDEMQKLEKLVQSLIDFAETFQFPVETERLHEVKTQVDEFAETCKKMEDGLVPLQQQIREVSHRMVRSRAEIIEMMDQAGKLSSGINVNPRFAA